MKIKVLHKHYDFSESPEPTTPQGEKPQGFCDYTGSRIVVSSKLRSGGDKEEVALHEVLHAVDDAMSIGLKEKEVHQISVGIFSVLKDNPHFRKYLFGGK